MDNKKRILLTSSLLMLPFTFGLFQLTTSNFGPKWGYVSGFAGYWTYCLLTACWSQASYHILLFTSSGMSAGWIMWQLIYIAATRVLYAWIYNNTGRSIFAVFMMHTLFNLVWSLFPRNTAWVTLARPVFYNPADLALITIVLATIITFLWDSKTLAQYRFAPSSQLSVKK